MQAGEIVMRPLRSTLEEHCLPALVASTDVLMTEQNGLAVARGVAVVLDAVFL